MFGKNRDRYRVSFYVILCVFVLRYDREETELTLDNVRHLVKLHDTAGQEDYERLRKMIYRDVNRQLLLLSYAFFNHMKSKFYFVG